jgi:hypothetical protein
MTVEYRTTGILGKLSVRRPTPQIALQPAIFYFPLEAPKLGAVVSLFMALG